MKHNDKTEMLVFAYDFKAAEKVNLIKFMGYAVSHEGLAERWKMLLLYEKIK